MGHGSCEVKTGSIAVSGVKSEQGIHFRRVAPRRKLKTFKQEERCLPLPDFADATA
jgi:hypothetical protein